MTVIKRLETYTHEQYGEVRVWSLDCRIEGVDSDGVIDRTVRVEFCKRPYKDLTTNLDVTTEDLETFIESIEGGGDGE